MQITLTAPERELLLRILNNALGNVRSGVRRTHKPEWHDGLKQEAELLKALLDKLDGS